MEERAYCTFYVEIQTEIDRSSDHRIGPCRAAEPRGRGTAVPRSQSTMAAYWHFVIMVVGGIETMWLSHCHTRGLLKWEPIWWVAIA